MTDDAPMGSADCERLRPGPLAQPVNASTSLAYLAAAGIVWCGHGRRGTAPRRREVGLYAGLLGLVGVGSVAFHGPQFAGAQQLHDFPIPALVAAAIGAPLWRSRHDQPPAPGRTPGRALTVLATGALGLACNVGRRTGARTCRPDSPIQLHGAWHLLSAASLGLAASILYAAPAPAPEPGTRAPSP